MSLTTDRAAVVWQLVRARWPEIPPLDEIAERDTGARMEYVETPELRHVLYLMRGILDDAVIAANALDLWHEGGHARDRARRASRLSNDEVDRFGVRRYGQAKYDELRARDQSKWGNRPPEHYAEHGKAIALGVMPNVGPDLGYQLCDLGVPLDRADMEAFFAPLEVETRIARFWERVNAMPPDAYLYAEEIGGWARNVMERDPGARTRVDAFVRIAQLLQAEMDAAA